MIGVGDKVFIDTNILVYAHLSKSPFFQSARDKLNELEKARADLWISRQTIREFLSVMTRKNQFTADIPLGTLLSDLKKWTGFFYIAEDGDKVTETLLYFVEKYSLSGNLVHDGNIVATMQVYDIPCLLTHNVADFTRFGEIINVVPMTITKQS